MMEIFIGTVICAFWSHWLAFIQCLLSNCIKKVFMFLPIYLKIIGITNRGWKLSFWVKLKSLFYVRNLFTRSKFFEFRFCQFSFEKSTIISLVSKISKISPDNFLFGWIVVVFRTFDKRSLKGFPMLTLIHPILNFMIKLTIRNSLT